MTSRSGARLECPVENRRKAGRPPSLWNHAQGKTKFSGPEFGGVGGVLREFVYLADFAVF